MNSVRRWCWVCQLLILLFGLFLPGTVSYHHIWNNTTRSRSTSDSWLLRQQSWSLSSDALLDVTVYNTSSLTELIVKCQIWFLSHLHILIILQVFLVIRQLFNSFNSTLTLDKLCQVLESTSKVAYLFLPTFKLRVVNLDFLLVSLQLFLQNEFFFSCWLQLCCQLIIHLFELVYISVLLMCFFKKLLSTGVFYLGLNLLLFFYKVTGLLKLMLKPSNPLIVKMILL